MEELYFTTSLADLAIYIVCFQDVHHSLLSIFLSGNAAHYWKPFLASQSASLHCEY